MIITMRLLHTLPVHQVSPESVHNFLRYLEVYCAMLDWLAWDPRVLSSNHARLLNFYQVRLTHPVIVPRSAK